MIPNDLSCWLDNQELPLINGVTINNMAIGDDDFCARCACLLPGIRIQRDGAWYCVECYREVKYGRLADRNAEGQRIDDMGGDPAA